LKKGELTMHLGKQVRLKRIFSHSSGNLCSVAVDHFTGYQAGLPPGLTNVPKTIREVMAERPDAMSMLKGMAQGCWGEHAGKAALVIMSICFTPDDGMIEQVAYPEEAMLMGADALAVAIGVRGPNEGKFLKMLSTAVELANRINYPIIAHIYPRDFSGTPKIVYDPENIMWAVRCGIECGADVIKVPFTGDVASYREIVATSPVPVVAAGGPKAESLERALELVAMAKEAGAKGATVGRNIWSEGDVGRAVRAFKAVIHDGVTPKEALKA